jgi:nicotinate-nucleotide--dimethylbenzimidazole phosphoribosyltransferase
LSYSPLVRYETYIILSEIALRVNSCPDYGLKFLFDWKIFLTLFLHSLYLFATILAIIEQCRFLFLGRLSMNLLKQTLSLITPPDEAAMQYARNRLDTITKPQQGFGYLENILIKYAGITGQTMPQVPKKCTIVVCADHGVAEMGVSAYPVETTVQMTRNYLVAKGAVANALSNFSGAHMIVVDMGIATSMEDLPGLINRKIDYGTKNMAKGPAMSRAQAIEALTTGIELVNEYAKQGYQCFLPGEMGIANTTASAAIVATFGNLTPEQATGRGTNISDERLKVKIDVVRQALEVNKPNAQDGIDVLAKVGGFELGCIAGIMIGAAANHCVVMLDGFNTGVAALIANSICPLVRHYLIGSHLAAEPAHKKMLELLDLKPYINMNFRLGEATGSSIAINFLDVAIKAYSNSTTCNKADFKIRATKNSNLKGAHVQLEQTLAKIQPLDVSSMETCSLYVDNLTKPIHSLGAIEDLAIKIAGITANSKPNNLRKTILLFTSNDKTTEKILAQCACDFSAIHTFAKHAEAELRMINVDVKNDMTTAQMLQAIHVGINIANEQASKGMNIIGLGTSGVDNHINSAAILFAYTGQTLASHQPDITNPLDVLNKLGDAQIAALVGTIIASASNRCAIVLDNFTTTIAALLAVKIAPEVKDYLIASQLSPDPAHKLTLSLLDLPISLNLDMSIGQGCASALGMKLLDASMHMLNDMKTFGQAAVAVANDGPGAKRQNKNI